MPLDRMILETDAPYLTPDKFRSELNEPKFIPLIAEKISEIRGVDLKIIEEATYQNTLKLFDKIK
jgi:TatD DNase family protein